MDDQKRRYLFEQLKTLLQGYGDVLEIDSSPGKYSLSTTKDILVDDEIHQGYQFVEIRELKNLVGFYFIPIQVCPDLREFIPESLQSLLKGTTCFNIKSLTPEVERGIKEMMKFAMDEYRLQGWL
jgi:hypothetical protein